MASFAETLGEFTGLQESRQAGTVRRRTAGKARNKAMKRLVQESRTLASIKEPGPKGRPFHGMPGELHVDVIQRYGRTKGLDPEAALDDFVDVFYQPKPGKAGEYSEHTGFTDVHTGKYMTREETAQKFGAVGEAERQIKEARKLPADVRVGESRRGVDWIEAERIKDKRKQANRLLQSLNRGIRGAATPSVRGRLLNRRGLVRAIAKRSGYLGLAIAAGDAISQMLNSGSQEK